MAYPAEPLLTPEPGGPVPADAHEDPPPPDPREVEAALLALAGALVAAGEEVAGARRRTEAAAAAYGYPEAAVGVAPTAVTVSLTPGAPAVFARPPEAATLRLDRAGALTSLAGEMAAGDLEPADALARLEAIGEQPHRSGTVARIGGHVLLTVGLALMLRPSWGILLPAVYFGALAGLLKIAMSEAGRRGEVLLAAVAAVLISAMSFLVLGQDSATQPVRALVPALAAFLPAGLLVAGAADVAAGELTAAAGRLLAAVLQILLLGVGIVIGAQLAGLPPVSALTAAEPAALGAWAPWAGVLLVGVGVAVFHSAPREALAWVLLVVAAAWVGQRVGALVLSAPLSGFTGALVALLVAVAVERRTSRLPAFAAAAPAVWLLVPGALGLTGIAGIVGAGRAVAVHDLDPAVTVLGAIALGLLAGAALAGWTSARERPAAEEAATDPPAVDEPV